MNSRHFIDAITTNETHFFRTPEHFDWFAGPFLDEMIARATAGKRERSLRIWSAACSTGEEPYTLAICLAENAPRLAGWTLQIVGTDICTTALATARTATYGPKAIEHVSPERLARHFTANPAGDTWRLKPAVAGLCEFRRHNLLEPMAGSPFDCIVIRNVLIYFDRTSKPIAPASSHQCTPERRLPRGRIDRRRSRLPRRPRAAFELRLPETLKDRRHGRHQPPQF